MSLFTTRRFLPLFVTQFLGAFNDNLFKNALVMLVTYRIATEAGINAQLLVTAAGGIFILPFFLFSATAGQLADKLDRARIARAVKLVEILLMGIAALGFLTSSVPCLMLALFLMGVHSTFFGPIKYALLPQHLHEDELMAGNAYVEAGTFLAILIGTIAGGLIVLQEGGTVQISLAVIAVAMLGYGVSRSIPAAPAPEPELKIQWNIASATWSIMKQSAKNSRVFRCVLGISWFWLVGATFLSQFPVFAKDVLSSDETVVTLLLTVFSVGIAIGSVLCNKLLRGQLQSTYVPIAAIGITLFMVDLYFASLAMPSPTAELHGVSEFLAHWEGKRVLLDLLAVALCGGMYIVPLYAIMQHDSDPNQRARVIAANNVMNALFMVVSAVLIVLLLKLQFTIPQVFLSVALMNAVVAIYICTLLPDAFLRSVARLMLRACYGVKITGLEHFTQARKTGDGRVLLVANHTSFLDAALIAAFLPEKITFAVNTHVANRWWMQPMLALVDAFPLDPTNPMATKALIDVLKTGKPCMIFPEGRITVTGTLMKIYEGPAMIADKSAAQLLPIRIEGAQYSPFSRLKGKVRRQLFPHVSLNLLPPQQFTLPEDVKGRTRRQLAGRQLYKAMVRMMFESTDWHQPLLTTVINASVVHGKDHLIAEDPERKPMHYGSFLKRVAALGKLLKRTLKGERALGLLLPTSIPMLVSFFALHAIGRVPAMLNFTAGASVLLSACRTAEVKTILTSRRFIAAMRAEATVAALQEAGIRVLYLEELTKEIRLTDKLTALLFGCMPRLGYRLMAGRVTADDTACILFTSGSEGTPKGVVLSHSNIQANRAQIASSIDFGPQDIVFNCMPMFHAFGLTGGTLLPLLSGLKTFYYPSPLHYRIVPELVYDTNATILFGTDTFLSGYAKTAHPYDLHSIRYIVAGAEKLKDETRKTYMEKFGLRIFEGYGATECAPVISVNTPMLYRAGSVGHPLPGIEVELKTVPGIEEGGQLWVRGPNIMRGYLKAEKPGILQPPQDGWYDTGDIVRMDEAGYMFIMGRTKRFAKIAGEMVSLSVVESAVAELWPEIPHAVVSLPDEKKGEQIILLTQKADAERAAIQAYFKEKKLPELALPRQIVVLDKLPLLGTGKMDYVAARKLAEEKLGG